ncbi:MAG: RDD family protein [Elusimicrobiaceae bacterium]|nr:RDD family protein [Elusimicrobiaceae bacterium]
MEKVSLKKLLIAYTIDMIILDIAINVFWLIMGPLLWRMASSAMSWMMLVISLAIYVFYFTVCERCSGKTLGKKVVGLQTITADGGNLPFGRVLGAYTIDLALLAIFMRIFWRLTDPLSEQIIQSCANLYKCLFVSAAVSTFISVVIYVAYFVIPEHLTGKTLGKKLLGLQVVPNKK